MAQCYVMMPYGGNDPERKSFFEGVYNSIIVAAARNAGFSDEEIIREDHKGEAGTVSRNIVNHLAGSDVLIADLTEQNANVYYELGVSHVFHKSSTVLICEKGTEIPFDVQGLSIVLYSTNITEMSDSLTRITNAILDRLSGKSSADNTIHESIPQLPDSLLSFISSNDEEREDALTQLSIENQQLRKKLEAAGVSLSGTQQSKRSPQEIIAQAKKSLPFSDETAIETFRRFADNRDYEGLFDYFMEVVEHGQISVSDAHTIIQICESTNSVLVRETAIEVFAQMFPDDSVISTMLAKVYTKRPSTRDKAVRTINEAIGLERDENGAYCSVNKFRLSYNNLARFFDTYIAIEAYDELVTVARYLLHNGAETEADLINRNIFNALYNLRRFDEAKEMLPTIEAQDNDQAYYHIAMYYDRIDRTHECYSYFEKALFADPTDDYFRLMATQILDAHVIRIDEDTIVDVSAREAQLAAVPFLFYVLQRTQRHSTLNSILSVFQRPFNHLTSYLDPVKKYLRGEIETLPYDNLDLRPLQYCLNKNEASMR